MHEKVRPARRAPQSRMSAEVYARAGKTTILSHPEQYSWNCVLAFLQFTQEELLQMRAHLDVPTMVRYQTCLTRQFLREHFTAEIDACPDLDWREVESFVLN